MAQTRHSRRGSGTKRTVWSGAVALALLVALAGLAGCDLFGGDGGTSASADDSVALAQLQWCDKPLITFQDNGTTAHNTLTNWDAVKD